VEEIMDDGCRDVAGEWVDLGQFARRLGIARSSVYGRIRRGTLQTRPKGNRGLEILWQPSRHHRENGNGHATPMVGSSNGADVAGDVLLARLDRAELELAAVRAQVAELRERLATAKAERDAARAVAIADVATAQTEVAAKDQIIADLREQVQWLRLPWWRRMLGN
jgi:hypothetical protein